MDVLGRVHGHPLTLLLVGAAPSGLLVRWVARGRQDRREAVEVEVAPDERVRRPACCGPISTAPSRSVAAVLDARISPVGARR